MCAPVAVALPLIAGGLQAAGSLSAGVSASRQGRYESQIAQRNADLATQNARDSIEMGADERRRFWRDVSRSKGEQVAAMAANGIDVGEGIGAVTQDDTRTLSREDAANLNRNIDARTKGSLIDASNYIAEARAARAKGKAALVGSVFEAAGSLASGFQQFGAVRAKMGAGK